MDREWSVDEDDRRDFSCLMQTASCGGRIMDKLLKQIPLMYLQLHSMLNKQITTTKSGKF